ncbi:MAG: RdgB/HAM1 family non-canonical purine NTP pyrophosphatase [Christensenellaceae bacterium]|nr:RdgB/HAM1 family non-canonical purine NTP pyrophosphatase [Christensenellaceae bacterium]
MKRLIIATGNQGKVREIKKILENEYDEIISMKEAGISADIVEDADTFMGNAAIKALTISRLTDGDVLADDSGLCVDGLGGGPGVYSARYSEAGTDEENNKKLVAECTPLTEEQRTAHYVCAIVLARGGKEIFSCEGRCTGRIVLEAQGNGGFGYDPYFYLPQYGMTFGLLPAEEKNKMSHRALALQQVQQFFREKK